MSDDCLTINVWRPSGTTSTDRYPVMVFIYGGAFFQGGSNAEVYTLPKGSGSLYDGAYLSTSAGENIVVVTFNYRLGALGFLASPKYGLTGNYGLMDQQLALQWVHDNIASFGGDPGKVTLFGESAGAMSVGLHLVSIPPTNYFQSAIMQSNPLGIPYKTLDQAGEIFDLFAESLECQEPPLECLTDMKAQKLAKAEENFLLLAEVVEDKNYPFSFHSTLLWAPVIGGSLLAEGSTLDLQPIEAVAKGNLDIPVIIGTNLSEGLLFANELRTLQALGKTYQDVLVSFFGTDRVDQKIYPDTRYQDNNGGFVPAMGRLFSDYVFTCANQFFAKNAKDPQNVYTYQFNQVSDMYALSGPSCKERPCAVYPDQCLETVCHAAELPFVFHSTGLFNSYCGTQFNESCWNAELTSLSDTMSQAWVRFAAHGSPGDSWPPFSLSTYRLFDTDVTTGKPVQAEISQDGYPGKPSTTPVSCSLWNDLVTGSDTQLWNSYAIEDPSTCTGQPEVPNFYMKNHTMDKVTTCCGNFYSTNYPYDYPASEVTTMTFIPSFPGKKITLDFTAFDTELGYDILAIHDGPNFAGRLIGAYSGDNLPPKITSTADDGTLTAVFTSDPTVQFSGWQAIISCQ